MIVHRNKVKMCVIHNEGEKVIISLFIYLFFNILGI